MTIFLEHISGEQQSWLAQAAPFADENYHSAFFIEYLNMLVDTNPQEVGAVYIAMMAGTRPTYDAEHITSILEKLYTLSQAEMATQICNLYGEDGKWDLVKQVYGKHSS